MENACKVLIVDDEADLVDMYKDYFESENIKVITAIDGESAYEIFLNNKEIELVISDSNMGKIGGLDLLKMLNNSTRKKPIFYLATGDLNKEEVVLKNLGVNRIIYKPFDLDEVISFVKADLKL